ncbi:alkaline phosphatase family protein [Micromonospora sp. NPDC047465]|uniref:alkaline phosphatase family protein n=1 Tax=Micromonospora sp. NPDC047465 TaxID=3154813 RepID=UPI0033E4B67C
MIRTLRTLGHVTAALALPLLTSLPAYAAVPDSLPARAAPAADHVILIGLDGFDYDYLGEVPTPNIDQLVKRGSVTESTGVMQSITNPSWSSIATGAWPERHLNTAYVYDPVSHTARGQERDLAVPTIAEAVRAQGGTVMSSQWFIVQNHGTAYGDPEGIYTQPGGDCSRRVDDIVKVIKGEPVKSGATMVTAPKIPDLMAVYCDALDAIGHEGGDLDPRIPSALADLDAQIGRIVQATKDADIFGRTTFVITGDHGMTTFTKGFGTQMIDAIAKAGYKAELLGTGRTPKPDTDAVIVVGGIGSLHLVGAAKNDPQAVAKIKAALEATPHVSQVFDKAAQQAMHMSPRFGELVIEPEPGWSIGGDPAGGVAGRHGATTELHIPLVLSGAGVLPGLHPVDPNHVDIAPTIAALLGIQPPSGAQGRVLSESIRD